MKALPILATVIAAATLGAATNPANAVPAFCTGTTQVVTSGTFVAGNFLVNTTTGASTGNCVEAADKFFGGFHVAGAITGNGSAGWLFTMAVGPADVTLAFQGLVGSSSTGSVDYDVAVDPLKSNGALISELEKDFTFNSLGLGSTATLTGTTTPGASSFMGGDVNNAFKCTRTATASTCPDFGFYNPNIDMLTVDETITTGPNTNVTALTDTIFQAVPEPDSLALLGGSLFMLGLVGRHHNRRRQNKPSPPVAA